MLDDKEIKIIFGLIDQGKSNYKIGQETGHSPNTINDIREEYEKTKNKQTQGEDERFKSAEDMLRRMATYIDTFIHTQQLDDREKKKWEKRLEIIQEILRLEVDERISKERADAFKKRDQEWKKVIEQNYVKKEVVTNLQSTIQSMDTTIVNIWKIVDEKDEQLLANHFVIFNLRSWL